MAAYDQAGPNSPPNDMERLFQQRKRELFGDQKADLPVTSGAPQDVEDLFQRAKQSLLAAERERELGERGLIGSLASTAARGLYGAGELGLRALRGLPGGAEPGDESGLSRAIEGMEQYKERTPFLQPKEEKGWGGTWRQGAESAVTSLSTALPGAAAGFAIGGPVGALVGGAASYIAGAPAFGVAEYDRFVSDGLKSDRYKKGEITRDQIEAAAIRSGVYEGGFEFLSNIIEAPIMLGTGGISRMITTPAKQALKKTTKQMIAGGIKGTAKRMGVTAGAEVPSEMLTAGFQAKEQELLTGEERRFFDAAKEAFGPSMVASMIFGGVADAGFRANVRQQTKLLGDPEADPQQRLKAVEQVGRQLDRIAPQYAEKWRQNATEAVTNGNPVDERLVDETGDLSVSGEGREGSLPAESADPLETEIGKGVEDFEKEIRDIGVTPSQIPDRGVQPDMTFRPRTEDRPIASQPPSRAVAPDMTFARGQEAPILPREPAAERQPPQDEGVGMVAEEGVGIEALRPFDREYHSRAKRQQHIDQLFKEDRIDEPTKDLLERFSKRGAPQEEYQADEDVRTDISNLDAMLSAWDERHPSEQTKAMRAWVQHLGSQKWERDGDAFYDENGDRIPGPKPSDLRNWIDTLNETKEVRETPADATELLDETAEQKTEKPQEEAVPVTVDKSLKAMSPEDLQQAYVDSYNDKSEDERTSARQFAPEIRKMAKRLNKTNDWSPTSELTPKPRYNTPEARRYKIEHTTEALKWLRENGVSKIAWDNQGNPYHAKADTPLPSWLTQSEKDEDIANLPSRETVTSAVQPWKVTQKEFEGTPDEHRQSIEKALTDNKPVPVDVLKDYYDLKNTQVSYTRRDASGKQETVTMPADVAIKQAHDRASLYENITRCIGA